MVYPSTSSVVCFYLDNLNSRRVVLNSTGTVVDRYRYSAWGVATQDVGSDDYRSFTGKDYDATGLLYFNARYYDPTTGRFLTEDPSRNDGN
jgi:RHS repeat-associated protein